MKNKWSPLYCLLFVLILIGCGKMQSSNQQTARSVFHEMYENGEISAAHLAYLEQNTDPNILNQSYQVTQVSDTSLIMDLGGKETTIDIQREGQNTPITGVAVNGHELHLKGEKERRRGRNILEALLGALDPNSRDDLENNLGMNLGDLIDLGYAEDRDEAALIALGTLVLRSLGNFSEKNPDKPFVALYAFGNSPEAVILWDDKNASQDHRENIEKSNAGKIISGVGLVATLFNPALGIIIRVLGALATA